MIFSVNFELLYLFGQFRIYSLLLVFKQKNHSNPTEKWIWDNLFPGIDNNSRNNSEKNIPIWYFMFQEVLLNWPSQCCFINNININRIISNISTKQLIITAEYFLSIWKRHRNKYFTFRLWKGLFFFFQNYVESNSVYFLNRCVFKN